MDGSDGPFSSLSSQEILSSELGRLFALDATCPCIFMCLSGFSF